MSNFRIIPLTFDEGNLSIFDSTPVTERAEGDFIDICSQSLSELFKRLLQQENDQLLDSPTMRNLPEPITQLPRALPIPKPKPISKWQEFARKKGIMRRKKGALEFDESRGEWNARHCKRSSKNKSKQESSWIKDWKAGDEFDDQ
jgi:regulator of ribosome biosynthesis